ncbi:hypothetical protein BH11BAC6_BH11BAC6_14260 [soil metagenome]
MQNGYNGNLNNANSYKLGFTGLSAGFVQTVIDLSAFANKAVKIRFSFLCDANTFVDGWYIDDILLRNESGITNIGQLFDNTNTLQNISAARTAIRNGSLPVTWGNFTAVKQGNTALLKWQTLQEHNTSKFVIERSTDGNNFYPLGSVTAAGEAASLRNYQFIDALPLNGNDHYRIAQIDKDGKTIYSAVATLNFLLNRLITITPNPAKDKIAITVTGNNKPLKVYLLSAIGQQVKSYYMNGQYLQVSLPYTAPGIYYVKITGEGISHTQKLIIE